MSHIFLTNDSFNHHTLTATPASYALNLHISPRIPPSCLLFLSFLTNMKVEVEVEVVSKEIIKPSSPTPNHLRHYRLSLLDQSSPKFYNPLVLYYAFKNNHKNASEVTTIPAILKRSLSAILSHYYPLAGRLEKEGRFMYCNDEGIPFLEARVKCQLSQVLNNPIAQELINLCPFRSRDDDDVHEVVLGVQLNVFECGGIAIGASFSDKIADALSWMRFFRTWSAITRSPGNILPNSLRPEFISAALFPPRTEPMIDAETCVMKKGIITKIFSFDKSAIEALRARYWQKNDNFRPSRVETLSTFIVSRFEASTNSENKSAAKERFYTILHTVNLHPRFDPPLSENSFGNYLVFAATHVPASSINGEASITSGVVKKIREAVRKVDKEYLRKLQMGEEDEQLRLLKERSKSIEKRGGEMIEFQVTSLSRFPFYEVDFGWGKPDWSSTAAWNFDKIIAFMDNSKGDGIEAYVYLKEEDMAKLEADKEIRNYTTPRLSNL